MITVFFNDSKTSENKILKHLTDLPELKNAWNNEQKLAVIENLYRELSNPSHPVSIAMKRMQDIREIRIIEGLDK